MLGFVQTHPDHSVNDDMNSVYVITFLHYDVTVIEISDLGVVVEKLLNVGIA